MAGLVTAVAVDRIGAVIHARTPSCADLPERCGASGTLNAGPLSATPKVAPSAAEGPEVEGEALDRHLAAIDAQVQAARAEFMAADEAYTTAQANPKTLPQDLTKLEGELFRTRHKLTVLEHQKADVVRMKSTTPSSGPVPVVPR